MVKMGVLLVVTPLILALINLTKATNIIQPNHIVNFINLTSEFRSSDVGKSVLVDCLKNLTRYNDIVIDSFTNESATWHIQSIGEMPDCPLEEINKLNSSIIKPNGEYTREFKMLLTEEFSRPSQVIIELLGPCEEQTNKVKRNRIEISPPPELVVSDPPTIPLTTPEMKPSAPPLEFSSTPSPTTTSITTDFSFVMTNTTVNDSFFDDDAFDFTLSKTNEDNVTSITTLGTTTPNTMTNLTEAATKFELPSSTSIPSAAVEQTTIAESSTSTTTPFVLITETTSSISIGPIDGDEAIEEEEKEKDTIIAANNNTDMMVEDKNEEVTDRDHAKSVNDDNWPHYGKYIGLSSGFVIFVAYIICSRSYRRQALMYEVNAQ